MIVKEYYSLPYISNSALKWFKKSPLYCYKRMTNEIEQLQKSYMDFGRQVHMSILEPEEFDKNYTTLDFNKPTSKQQLSFCEHYVALLTLFNISEEEAELQAYRESYAVTSEKNVAANSRKLRTELKSYIDYLLIQDKYKEVLSNNKFNLIQTIKNTLFSHKKASELFSVQTSDRIEACNELPIVWDFPITVDGEPLKCKSLIDRLIINLDTKEITLIDLKTAFSYEEFVRAYNEFNYPHQFTFYWLAVKHYFSDKYPDENFSDYKLNTYVTLVTTDPNIIECRVIEVPTNTMVEQTEIILKEMQEISWHVFTGQWDHTREYYTGDGIETI